MLSTTTIANAQIKKEKVADKDFEHYAYVNAIEIYERMANNGYSNTSILENLANAYYFNGKFKEANKWYTELFEGTYSDKDISKIPSEYYYRYAQTLKTVGDYIKSNEIMKQFAQLEVNDSRTLLFEKNKNYKENIDARAGRFVLTDLKINSIYSDYSGTFYGNQFVFTSARQTENANKSQIHSWTKQSFTALYSSKILSNGSFEQPVLFDKNLDSHVNEASAVFTKDGNTMYFTRNNTKSNGRSKQNKLETSVLKIYKATKQENGTWGDVTALAINSDDFNTAHPALTPDEKWLYFSSDRNGTLGQSDLFRVGFLDQEKLGPVENLGKIINTSGRETFPFISSNYDLYFASDGHPGLGGLDVFVSKIYPDGTFGPVVNMSEPINTGYDDFAFYFDPKLKKGFVSSNRPGGVGFDDIYFVEAKKCEGNLQGKVYNVDTKETLANTMLIIADAMYQTQDTIYSNNQGQYTTQLLDCGTKYRIQSVVEGYNTIEVSAVVSEDPAKRIIDMPMEKTQKQLGINDDLFKTLKLAPIYFDFDQSNIRPDAALELMKIVEVMKQNPTIMIDVRSHTDSKGNDDYNLALSDRRVKSTIKWMIEHGIEPNRLTGKGYGETQLLNKCSNEVQCSPEEHQLNRRSEFIITKM